ncbi:MAG TPA: oxygenase MpaB family protein [Saprospiraceae bacterium]|nr:oxygenase MpaB family protein [Saprospiraceae bacterium]
MENKWSNELLDRMRETGDPEADKVAAILWKNRNNKNIVEDLRMISRDHHLKTHENIQNIGLHSGLSDNEVETIAGYFESVENISKNFNSKDYEYFNTSAELFRRYGFNITLLLFFKSLPTGYMCPKPGHVLESTKLLEDFAARRVMETAQFVFAVNTANWYEPHSAGMNAIQRVRLMHAGMRMALLNDNRPGREWNPELGVPINQEDLALTNHLFSLAIIEGLDQMGIHLFDNERHAIFHTWQKIGHAMGIGEELIADDYEEGWNQYTTILERQISENNPAGSPLTHALLSAMNEITHEDIPMKALEDLTYYFLNDRRAIPSLGLHPPSIFERFFIIGIQYIMSLKLWKRMFHHNRSGVFNNAFRRAVNGFLVKKYQLHPYMRAHKGVNPLEAFSKVMLNELHKRDLTNFEKSNQEDIQKKFLLDDELYMAWDLGGFELTK